MCVQLISHFFFLFARSLSRSFSFRLTHFYLVVKFFPSSSSSSLFFYLTPNLQTVAVAHSAQIVHTKHLTQKTLIVIQQESLVHFLYFTCSFRLLLFLFFSSLPHPQSHFSVLFLPCLLLLLLGLCINIFKRSAF